MSTTDDVCELRRRLLVALLWRAACLTWLREAIEDEDRRRTIKRAVIMVPNMNPDASDDACLFEVFSRAWRLGVGRVRHAMI